MGSIFVYEKEIMKHRTFQQPRLIDVNRIIGHL